MKFRLSLGFQLALVTALAVAAAVGVWGTALRVLVRHHLEQEATHRALRYAEEMAVVAAPALERGLRGAERRELEALLGHLSREPGVLSAELYTADHAPLLRAGVSAPAAAAVPAAVRGRGNRLLGWVRVAYSAEEAGGLFGAPVPHGLSLLAVLLASFLGFSVYAASWFLVFRPIRRILQRPRGGAAEQPSPNELGLLLRRYRELERRQEESEENLALLFAAAKTMSAELDIQEVYNRVLDLVWRRVDRAPCLLWLRDGDGFLRIKNFRNVTPELVRRGRVSPGEGGVGRCFEGRKAVVVAAPAEGAAGLPAEYLRDMGVRAVAHFPLVVEGRCEGVLTACSVEARGFEEDRVPMIATLMDYLSLAAKNARLYDAMQGFNRRLESEVAATTRELTRTNARLIKRVRELRALYDVAAVEADPARAENAISRTVGHAADLLETANAGVFLWDERAGVFRGGPAVSALPAGAATWRGALEAGETLLREDPADAALVFPGAAVPLALAPLRAQGGFLGFLAAAGPRSGRFEPDDLQALTLLARHLSDTLLAARLRGERERRLRDLTALQEVASVLRGEPDLDQTLRQTARIVAEALGADVCAFLLHDEATGELVTQPGAHGFPEHAEPLLYRVAVDAPRTSSGRVFRTGEPFLSPDAQNDPTVNPHYAQLWDIRSLIVAPLVVESRGIGVLRVGHRSADVFGPDHLRLATLIAGQAAALVQNARLYLRVQEDVRELERLNNVKMDFLSMVSHELKTPLTAVKGFVAVLLNGAAGPITERQARFLGMAKQSVNRLALLIGDLLDTTHLEAGKVTLQPASVSLRALLEEAQHDHAPSAAERKIALEIVPGEAVPEVTADPHRVRQVIDNLIANALKFTPEGGRVALSLRATPEGAEVSVQDTGPGIPEGEQEKIFDKFYQVKSLPALHARGVGLGLAIAKSFVTLHGGRIWVRSKPGEGSMFSFVLPWPSSAAARAAQSA